MGTLAFRRQREAPRALAGKLPSPQARAPVGAAAPALGLRAGVRSGPPGQELALCLGGGRGVAASLVLSTPHLHWAGRGGRQDRRPWRPFRGLPSSFRGPGPSL